MNALSSRDREPFQQLLASAFAVLESQIDRQSLAAVMEVQRLLTRGELDVEGAMQHIVASARNVAQAAGVAIALLKGGQLIYRAATGSSASYIGRQLGASLTASADTNRSREILRVEDAQTDPRIEADICRQFGALALLILPIFQTQALAGVLEVRFSEAHAFQPGEVRTYQLMARQIEAAILQATIRQATVVQTTVQAAAPERKANPAYQRPTPRPVVPRVADQAQTLLDNAGSLPDPLPRHPITAPSGTARAPVTELAAPRPSAFANKLTMKLTTTLAATLAVTEIAAKLAAKTTTKIMWPWLRQNLAMAALSTALVLASVSAFSVGHSVSQLASSLRPLATAVDPQVHSSAAPAVPAKTTPASVQPAPVSEQGAGPATPRTRRVHEGRNEVEYIGEDVTVRYFTYPKPAPKPAPPPRTPTYSCVAEIGDDVTVRYFTPKPAPKPASR